MITSIIDVGTRSIKHFIFDDKMEIYHHKDSTIKLGDSIKEQVLGEEGIDRAVKHIMHEMQKGSGYNAQKTIITATEALRQASNSIDFINRVKKETGITPSIITHEDETILLSRPFLKILKDDFAVLNIGGGSTEVTVRKNNSWHHIPIKLGVNIINQKFLKEKYSNEEYDDAKAWHDATEFIRQEISGSLQQYERLHAHTVIITGTLRFILKQQDIIDVKLDTCGLDNHPISMSLEKYEDYVIKLRKAGVKRLSENYPEDPSYSDNFAIGQSVYLAIAQKLKGKIIIPSEYQYIHGLVD